MWKRGGNLIAGILCISVLAASPLDSLTVCAAGEDAAKPMTRNAETIRVTMNNSGVVYVNPYGMDIPVDGHTVTAHPGAAISENQLISPTDFIVNQSAQALKVTASITPDFSSPVKLAETAQEIATAEDKRLYAEFQMMNCWSNENAFAQDTAWRELPQLGIDFCSVAVQDGGASSGSLVIGKPIWYGEPEVCIAPTYAAFRVTGTVVEHPIESGEEAPWTEEDQVNFHVAFTFEPVEQTAETVLSAGTVTGDANLNLVESGKDTTALTLTGLPDSLQASALQWRSCDPAIAEIAAGADGTSAVVTAKAAGHTDVVVSATVGGVTYATKYPVTVNQAGTITYGTVGADSAGVGELLTLELVSGCTPASYQWMSEAVTFDTAEAATPKIASVTAAGDAVVRVDVVDGNNVAWWAENTVTFRAEPETASVEAASFAEGTEPEIVPVEAVNVAEEPEPETVPTVTAVPTVPLETESLPEETAEPIPAETEDGGDGAEAAETPLPSEPAPTESTESMEESAGEAVEPTADET